MRVRLEAERCVASGQCVLVAPTVFDQDDDGVVVLLKEQPGETEREAVQQSVQLCPAAAIRAEA
ncbi:ferredoxin [Streptomyces sp. TM32]|uniref:ferredoxin n=1 Tax=Streptomyces sp. TM32 TaxID=1652669 RepID=UPI0010123114|nr:ferredoxin [Streptomyces sp. TM32]RXS84116.1 ferredoxin [Streptomyces sp. TM32]